MEDIYRRYRDHIAFFVVYVQEAHPTDGWQTDAAPERLYLIGADGRVAYHGGAGPHFFDFDTWEQAIAASVRAVAAL